jgi:hypothetical protein
MQFIVMYLIFTQKEIGGGGVEGEENAIYAIA